MPTNPVQPRLFLPTKNSASNGDQEKTLILYRTLERWSQQATVTSAGGGGGGYASLTGPGETTTPGSLTQQGGLDVEDNGQAITLDATGGVFISDSGSSGIHINANGAPNLFLTSSISDIQLQVGNSNKVLVSGAFDVETPVGSTGNITLHQQGSGGISIRNNSTSTGMTIANFGGNGLGIQDSTASGITIDSLSTGNIEMSCYDHFILGTSHLGGTISVFIHGGNPNTGGVNAIAKGDICFDNSTPGIWVATASGANWTMYTLP